MLYTDTEAMQRPEAVILETMKNGTQHVRLADNIREETREEGTCYIYDEVLFTVPADRQETPESIAAGFAAWWEYGAQPEEAITLEQRVSDLEALFLDLMGGM